MSLLGDRLLQQKRDRLRRIFGIVEIGEIDREEPVERVAEYLTVCVHGSLGVDAITQGSDPIWIVATMGEGSLDVVGWISSVENDGVKKNCRVGIRVRERIRPIAEFQRTAPEDQSIRRAT